MQARGEIQSANRVPNLTDLTALYRISISLVLKHFKQTRLTLLPTYRGLSKTQARKPAVPY